MTTALFSQLVKNTKIRTSRPELQEQIQLAVQDATKFCHMMDFWQRDSFEKLVQVNSAISFWQFSTSGQFDRFRKIRYIKKFDLDLSLPKEGEDHKLKEIGPDHLFDIYNRVKKNIFYLAGDNLQIRLSTTEQALIICYYQAPLVDAAHYNSWIAELYSVAITDLAASRIFRDVGQTEDADRLEKNFYNVHVPVIRMQDVEASA